MYDSSLFGRKAVPPFRSGHLLSLRSIILWLIMLVVACLILAPMQVEGADINATRELFRSGKYDECLQECQQAIEKRLYYGEDWRVLQVEALLMKGEYSQATETVDAALTNYSWSVRLLWVGFQAHRAAGHREAAEKLLAKIDEYSRETPWRYTNCDDLLILGRVALHVGADPKTVLEGFFERAKTAQPKRREPLLAIAELALNKNDHEMAAEILKNAAKQFPNDPDVHFLLSVAVAPSDPEWAEIELTKTLELNPHHPDALLLKVDQMIDSDRYKAAEELLQKVLAINPHHPHAWAFQSVIAHLESRPEEEKSAREKALEIWSNNPEVDHLIGQKLSRHYRFTEGVACQRRALEMDENFTPARIQLSQDLLRLGQEEEGWKQAKLAHEKDGYNVVTYNMLELHDELAKFTTLEDDSFIVRMEKKEAAIYGKRVQALLNRAKSTLCAKYGLELKEKIIVEIFPDENDFAVRTFGVPANSGYLGVCFGNVITANSPASQKEHPSNWESVLWHEFCHVVTLKLTHNKMPRWLSEGISVYEELQADPTWGQRMTPEYREMIFAGELTPLSDLSSAFMNPPTGLHLNFAYYESCLVVEYLVQNFGIESLQNILRDLGAGLPINVAIERHTTDIKQLEQDFEKFVFQRAKELAPRGEWQRPDLIARPDDEHQKLEQWLQEHPTNIIALTTRAMQLMDEGQHKQAQTPLKKLIELYPENIGPDNAYLMLAETHGRMEEYELEYAVLNQYAALDCDEIGVYLRLIEMAKERKDWPVMLENAERALAVNPLIPLPHRARCLAAEKLGQPDCAIEGYHALLLMEPADSTEVHYRLARLLHAKQDPAARTHVLAALERAPRYRAALDLLLEINAQRK